MAGSVSSPSITTGEDMIAVPTLATTGLGVPPVSISLEVKN